MSNETMQDLLDQYDVKTIKKGDVLEGTIISVDEKGASVNINYAFDGFISKDEISEKEVNPKEVLSVGDTVKVLVINSKDSDGYISLSRKAIIYREEKAEREAKRKAELKDIKDAFENEKTITIEVKEEIKGGLLCHYGNTRVFLPGSLVSRNKVSTRDFVGKDLEVKIVELDLAKNKIVASRRIIEEAIFKAEEEKNWNSLVEGEKVQGVVRNTTKFGAFVEVNGVQGLVHINDLAWGKVKRVEDVVKKGDKVEVFIGTVDKESKRLSLILKDNLQEPWTLHGPELKVGKVLKGKVKKTPNFGAFVELFPGIEGLVHLSELSYEVIKEPTEVVNVGDEITVKILSVDLEEKKLSLSKKDAEERKNQDYIDEEEGGNLGEIFGNLKDMFK